MRESAAEPTRVNTYCVISLFGTPLKIVIFLYMPQTVENVLTTFCEFLVATFYCLSPFLGKTTDQKTIIHSSKWQKNYHQLSCQILTCPNYMIVDDS